MFWILFGLVIGEEVYESRFFPDESQGKWTCNKTICENIPGDEIYLLVTSGYLNKFQLFDLINCSDCGMYNILVYDNNKYYKYIDNISIEDYKTRVE